MNQDTLAKAVGALAETGQDALVTLSPESFAYLTGRIVPSQPILRWRHAAVVVTSDGRTALFAVDMEESTVRAAEPDVDLRVWQEFSYNAMPTLAGLLTDLGLASARVAIETDYLPASDMEILTGLLPATRWTNAGPLLDGIRRLKTEREIGLMGDLARITDAAIGSALASVSAGDTDMDLAAAVTTSLFRAGADGYRWLIVATGERSQYPNVGPILRPLERGDVVRLEVFGMRGGYQTGVCRTAVVQEAPDDVAEAWKHIADLRQVIFDMVRPGASGSAIYGAVADRFRSLDWPRLGFVGHGIGVYAHEEPYIGSSGDALIEEGMVLGTEPVLLLAGRWGLQVKDIVAVGPHGCDVLSDVSAANELYIID